MDTSQIKKLAIEFLVNGCFSGNISTKHAIRCYSISWGFGRHIEDLELMKVCTGLLGRTGMSKEMVIRYQEIGYETASFGIYCMDKADKILGKSGLEPRASETEG